MSISSRTTPTYSRLLGFIFLFNLILGTGALALPKAFQQAGWLLSGIVLALIAVLSFIPATFIVEAMAIANALKLGNANKAKAEEDVDEAPGEHLISQSDFEINDKYELGVIINKLAGKTWTVLFYANISIYLYGDLAVYAAAVPKSLRDITCNSSVAANASLHENDPCWSLAGLSRMNVYRLYLLLFALLLGPFFFFNVTKTRWLQVGTTVFRWTAIILMVSLACARIVRFPSPPPNPSPIPHPAMADFSNLASVFGVFVYSFMCHHSIPGVLTPVTNKKRIFSRLMLPAYLIILICYFLLAGTAVAAFLKIHDLYTLNFVPDNSPDSHPGWLLLLLEYFLSLYPVLALSSTFPIVGTTLSNNLIALFRSMTAKSTSYRLLDASAGVDRCQQAVRYGVPLLALLPPILLAMFTNDIASLVGITGAFGGSGIQYIFPVVIVYYARKALVDRLNQITNDQSTSEGPSESTPLFARTNLINPYRSPFSHNAWLFLIGIWAVTCVTVVFLHKVHTF